jgi:two-component system, NarL family, sensor histidine kinase DesK
MSGRLAKLRQLRWETFAWLVYSLPYLASSFSSRLTGGETAAMLAGYVVFLALYFTGQLTRGPRILWVVAGFDVLAVAFTSRNPAAATFFIYGAALVAHGFAPRRAAAVLLGQALVALVASTALGMPWWYISMLPVLSAFIGAVTIQAAVTHAKDAKLRLAQAEVERLAKLAERERIARDLHDLLGHTLSVVVLKSELARKLIAQAPERAAAEIAEVERIARDGLAEVRQAVTGYRSSGLAGEIERVRDALTAAGIEATIDARTMALAAAQETALSLALREATTNVIRHAGASRCHIHFYAQDGSILMEVEDNGRGGDVPFGNGLTGMRERIQALGGVLTRETKPGTRILIKLPV